MEVEALKINTAYKCDGKHCVASKLLAAVNGQALVITLSQ
jgi:hypothetical protein